MSQQPECLVLLCNYSNMIYNVMFSQLHGFIIIQAHWKWNHLSSVDVNKCCVPAVVEFISCYRLLPLIPHHHSCCWLYTHKANFCHLLISFLYFVLNSLLGSVICGCGNPRLHLSRNPPGYGGWERQIWTRVWLVVPGGLHVWNAVRRDSFLCRILGGNLREDHEPQGGLTKLKGVNSPGISPVWPVNTDLNVIVSCTGEIPVPTADHRCFWGSERSDSPTYLQPRAPIGPEWHRGL